MKNIEEIIEMMKKLNPEIKMDKVFKKSLKNKLEVTSYAKIRNTKNKKINVAKSGFFSFKKDNSNIFDKPKFNFLKIISPIFVGTFAVFGFINFYGTDLFINNGDNFQFEVEKVEEVKNIKNNSLSTEGFSPLKEIEEKTRPVSETKIGIKKTDLLERKVENKIKEKTIIQRKVPVPIIKKLSPGTGTDKFIKENSIVNTEETTNTEIIDLLGSDESIENLEYTETVSSDNMEKFSGNINLEKAVPEIFNFIKFCEEKKGIIKNDICEYGELKCSKIDFENKKCD